ncbi:hypothetical protein [Deinococcus puniceus]|uniref:Uncharacterized protein n=1 Tax=Deinococcus puniceus TaxID=1182568 RepID=A0A172T8T6_9DEIO|nr:hypothetical protein [Deinococcus puniceus]ANE43356.1 hypothetical protein SU48_05785 [Deinococcus puniceus]
MRPLYTKCPVCFHIGGGGLLARFKVKATGAIFYACDQCESAWPENEPILITYFNLITGILLENGLPLENHRGAFWEAFDDTEFIAKDEQLRDLLYHLMLMDDKTKVDDPIYPYIWLVDCHRVIGTGGETKVALVLNRAETYILDAQPVK